jgi:hypothetical protein
MPSIFAQTDYQHILQRIEKLTPSSQAQWGKMNVSQMLAHLQAPIEAMVGTRKLKRGLIGFLFGAIAKKKLISGKPFSKNLPTDRSFIVADERDFNAERNKLITLLNGLHSKGESAVTTDPHPFFGKMTSH